MSGPEEAERGSPAHMLCSPPGVRGTPGAGVGPLQVPLQAS